MRPTLILGLAITAALAAPAAAQSFPRGDEPIAVPVSVKQGIDFVYVDPKLNNIARRHQRPQNWLGRLFAGPGQRVNPLFTDLQRGLQGYQASWGRLPQVKIPAGPTLKLGTTGKRVALLRQRLGLAPGGAYNGEVAAAVANYQRVHGLGNADGVAGKGTIASLNLGADYYARRIAINMERAFRLPQSRTFDRYVVIDSGGANALLFDRDRVRDQMRVVVGTVKTKTPMMAVLMTNAKANPYWHVPPELVKSLTAQKVKELGPAYFDQFHYEVIRDWTPDAPVIDPKTVNWAAIRTGKAKPNVLVRQLPGPWNSMGEMKFEMPNDFGIYLHDTPHKELFAEDERHLSNGCVRLQDWRRFAGWVFGGVPADTQQPEQVLPLPRPVPVFMTYLTVEAGPGGVTFRPDPYGFDALAMPQMFGGQQRVALAN